MNRMVLTGLSGVNPLGFMASLGLLRILAPIHPNARLAFLENGSFHAIFEGVDADLPEAVALDARSRDSESESWWLTYEKEGKRGSKKVADLKAPPDVFANYLVRSIESWRAGDRDAGDFAAAFGTSSAKDGNGNTKPTALHFTAANQQFLDTARRIRVMVTPEWARESLSRGASRRGPNLRWDPAADRNWALMANEPAGEDTLVDAPLEWLAFRALPVFPTLPVGSRVATVAVSGRGEDMTLTWPLWNAAASLAAVRSMLRVNPRGLHALMGVFVVCSSGIRRTAQGFGNFGPAAVTPVRKADGKGFDPS